MVEPRVRGGVCAALSHQRQQGGEGRATLNLEAWVPGGAHTLPAPGLEDTPPVPLPRLAGTCPVGPHGTVPPFLSPLERRQRCR